jgi:hypothetical protein
MPAHHADKLPCPFCDVGNHCPCGFCIPIYAPDTLTSPVDDIIEVFMLIRGTNSVLDSAMDCITHGRLKAMICPIRNSGAPLEGTFSLEAVSHTRTIVRVGDTWEGV